MKKKHIVALAVVLVLLLAARFLIHRSDSQTATDIAEAGLGRLVPDSVHDDDIRWIRVSGPAPKSDDATAPAPEAARPLELTKNDSGWVVTSAEGAPADESQVKDFVHRAVNLAGELRGEGESTFARFAVSSDVATKVEIGKEAGTPLATLWIGKAGDDAESHFARAEGSTEVRHVRAGLRAPLQLYSEKAAPAADLWVNKVVIDVKPEQLASLTVERPDATIVLEREAAPPAGETGATGEPPKDKWRIVSPEMPWTVSVDSLDGVVQRAARLRVNSIQASGSPACVFDAPAGQATFKTTDGASVTARIGGKVPDKEEVSVQVEGKPLCFGLGTWSVPTLLPRAASLWTIPQAFAESGGTGDPKRVRYQRGGTTHVLSRASSGDWSIDAPSKGKADSARATRLASAARNLRVEDVAEIARVPSAALAVDATITVEMPGKTLTVQVLGERAGGLGERYVKFPGGTPMSPGWIAVISKPTADSLLPTPDELKDAGVSTDSGD